MAGLQPRAANGAATTSRDGLSNKYIAPEAVRANRLARLRGPEKEQKKESSGVGCNSKKNLGK